MKGLTMNKQISMLSFADYPANRDSAGFGSGVDGLTRLIERSELPLAAAIYGKWGSGKSTFLNMVTDRLAATDIHGQNRFLIVQFEPWKVEQSGQVLYDLICAIHYAATKVGLVAGDCQEAKAMFQKMNDLGLFSVGDIVKMGATDVLDKTFGGGRALGGIFERYLGKNPQDRATERIEAAQALSRAYCNYLQKIAQIPVVVIDDLDRCDPETVVSILDGLKLFLQDPQARVVYLLAMDHEMVTKAICREHEFQDKSDGWQYLSKICNLSYYIPRPSIEALISDFCRELKKPNDRMENFWKFLSNAETHDLLYKCGLYTPRRLKKIIRELHMLISPSVFGFIEIIQRQISNSLSGLHPASATDAEMLLYRHLLGIFVIREAYPDLYEKIINKPGRKRSSLLMEIGIISSTFESLDNRVEKVFLCLARHRLSELHGVFSEHRILDTFAMLFSHQEGGSMLQADEKTCELLLNPLLDYMMGR